MVAAMLLLVLIWRPGWLSGRWRGIALRLAVLIVFVRFAVPVIVLANQAVYDAFLADRYQVSYTALEVTRDEAEALQQAEKTRLPVRRIRGCWVDLGTGMTVQHCALMSMRVLTVTNSSLLRPVSILSI